MTVNVRDVRGVIPALVTPFTNDGAIDFAALERLVERQIAAGVAAVSPCGTTGEATTLKESEYEAVIRRVVEAVRGRVPVIAGAGSNATEHAVHLTKRAAELGADAVLSVGPYYNKPTQEGYFQHFKAVAAAARIPVMVYNVPGRAGSNIEPRTIRRIAELENVFAVKEASGNVGQYMEIIAAKPKHLRVFSGDDALTLPMLAVGGDGIVSVAANLIPGEMVELSQRFFDGDIAGARALHYRYLTLMNINFIESNPIPVKYAMSRMKLIEPLCRLPLTEMGTESKRRMDEVLSQLELV